MLSASFVFFLFLFPFLFSSSWSYNYEFIRECVTTEGGDIFHTVAELISLARKYLIREDMNIPDEAAIRKSLVKMLGETKQHRTENGRVRGYFGLKVSMPEDDDVPF